VEYTPITRALYEKQDSINAILFTVAILTLLGSISCTIAESRTIVPFPEIKPVAIGAPISKYCYLVTDGTTYIAVLEPRTHLLVSKNGVHWTKINLPADCRIAQHGSQDRFILRTMAPKEHGFVAIAQKGSSDYYLIESDNGYDWHITSELPKKILEVKQIDYLNRCYLVVSNSSTTEGSGLFIANSTYNWIELKHDIKPLPFGCFNDGSTFYVVGKGLYRILNPDSPNPQIDDAFANTNLYGYPFPISNMAISLPVSKVFLSRDYLEWQEVKYTVNGVECAIYFDRILEVNNRYFAVTRNRCKDGKPVRFLYSDDLQSWKIGNLKAYSNFIGETYDICYGKDGFVALGASTLYQSQDGVNWKIVDELRQYN
jgi:hypothetical protein